MACLAKDPAARPQRAAEVHDRLLEIAADPALDLAVRVPAPNPAAALAPRRTRRTLVGRVGMVGGGAVVGGLALVGLVVLVARIATGDAPPPAAAARPAPIELALPFSVDLGRLPAPAPAPAPAVPASAASAASPDHDLVREHDADPRARARATAVADQPRAARPRAGRAATIDFLTYDPAAAVVGEAITVTGTVTFEDPDGDVVALGSQVRPPTRQRAQTNRKIRMVLAGATSGTAAFTFVLRPTAPGPHPFDVWVVDEGGNLSNLLTGHIDVSEPP
jgi:hypothetical protein